jgi:hypothetical protein
MDHIKEKLEKKRSYDLSWANYAIKQGYLIQFHRGLLKAPKMQYFILTESGLIWFEQRPRHDTKPICFLPYEQLSSIKVDNLEYNNFQLSCMQVTSKLSPSFTVAFKCKEERDEWMMIMMKAFSEALLTTPNFNRTRNIHTDEDKTTESEESATDSEDSATDSEDSATESKESATDSDTVTQDTLERRLSLTTKEMLERTSSYGQTLRRKRRKGDRGSIRRSKSCDMLASNDATNTESKVPSDTSAKPPTAEAQDDDGSFPTTRKRKSEPDIHDVPYIPRAWTTESKEKYLTTSCSIEHIGLATVEKQLKNKSDTKHKSNMFLKLFSKFENPTLLHAH